LLAKVGYGFNTFIGQNYFSNYNLVIQDEGEVHIGDNVMIASNVILTTNLHPLLAQDRVVQKKPNRFPHNYEGNYVQAKPIYFEDNVWIWDDNKKLRQDTPLRCSPVSPYPATVQALLIIDQIMTRW